MTNRTTNAPVAAIIAAAGRSQRMGSPKQLLAWGASTVIATVVENLSTAGAAPVVCVVGHQATAISQALGKTHAQLVFNPDYAVAEMLGSYQAGIRSLAATACSGTLIALGDQPHIPAAVIRQVVAQAQTTPDQLVIPSYNLRRGHPFYVPRRLWSELLVLRADETLRTLLTRHADAIVYVTVDTDAILRDMDTPEAYNRLTQAGQET